MQFILLIIVVVVLFVYVFNSKSNNSMLKKLSYIAVGLAILFVIISMIQPSEYIKFSDTTISNQTNKK